MKYSNLDRHRDSKKQFRLRVSQERPIRIQSLSQKRNYDQFQGFNSKLATQMNARRPTQNSSAMNHIQYANSKFQAKAENPNAIPTIKQPQIKNPAPNSTLRNSKVTEIKQINKDQFFKHKAKGPRLIEGTAK